MISEFKSSQKNQKKLFSMIKTLASHKIINKSRSDTSKGLAFDIASIYIKRFIYDENMTINIMYKCISKHIKNELKNSKLYSEKILHTKIMNFCKSLKRLLAYINISSFTENHLYIRNIYLSYMDDFTNSNKQINHAIHNKKVI